jgi:hypothetical protein
MYMGYHYGYIDDNGVIIISYHEVSEEERNRSLKNYMKSLTDINNKKNSDKKIEKNNFQAGGMDNTDNNVREYDTLEDMLPKLVYNQNKTIFINAPYRPRGNEYDPVEENLYEIERSFGSTVLHPPNDSDVQIILNHRNVKSNVMAIIVTGGHGDRGRPGQIGGLNFRNIRVSNNNLSGKVVYFPDCSLGTPRSMNILQRSLGSDVRIYAKEWTTLQTSVADFILGAARSQNRPEGLPRLFGYIRRAL